MLTEDYLMRMIRIAVMVIQRLIGLRTAGLYTDALFLIDQTLEQLTGLRSDMLERLDDASIIAMLTNHEGVQTDRLQLLADFVKEKADIYASIHSAEESRWRYLRALNFYLEVVLTGGPQEMQPPYEKIDALVGTLGEANLPVEYLYPLFASYEIRHGYAQAARVLDRLLQSPAAGDDLRLSALEFYRRLEALPDAELAATGLSRAAVGERIARLRVDPR